MTATSPDDDLLAILLTNLRCAASTFGEGTPPYESIRTTIEDHMTSMKAAARTTRLTAPRGDEVGVESTSARTQESDPKSTTMHFSNLVFRPKAQQ
ncbi:hypothetical protein B0A54_06583 [Friedmanniomyces endolithicus]|uniref:Uncharacterized protein n=1 Tax=Friedmanniomyces endolithicus TaxID=329885 RepID=A0A4U0V159_9PEZI|nr:hypothetical protein B0A54_06583 [Friedmanniomyces endolithicus]